MNQIKHLIMVSFGLLVSASQCSGRAAAASSSQSVEPDYGLIAQIAEGAELAEVVRVADAASSYPMIAQSVGLSHKSRIIFLGDNHENHVCGEIVAKIMATNKIDRIFIEGDMFGIHMNSGKVIKDHAFYCQFLNFMCRGNVVASTIAVQEAFKRKVKIPVESIEFDDLSSAISYFGGEGFQVKDLIEIDELEERHPLFYRYLNLRDRRMAWNIMRYLEGLKKQEICLVIVGYLHLHNLKSFLEKHVGAFNGMFDYETFRYVEDLNFEQD